MIVNFSLDIGQRVRRRDNDWVGEIIKLLIDTRSIRWACVRFGRRHIFDWVRTSDLVAADSCQHGGAA